jgi:hypothetical protein
MSYILNSPAFTGTPTGPTPATADNTTKLATTAFVKAQGYLTGNQNITFSGDATGSGTTAVTLTLAASGVTAGTYKSVTVNAKGLVTAGTNPTTLAGYGITDAVNSSLLGVANGVATLDATGKVPVAQLPSSVLGGMTYQGTWNATTNTPALASGVGTKGWYYKVATAGTTSIDGNANWTLGDLIVFDGTVWEQVQGGSSDVVSVAGKVGVVTLVVGDVSGAAPLASPTFTGTVTAPTFVGALTGTASNASQLNGQSASYYTSTTNITEGTNLYFTNARAIGATLTGFSATAGGNVAATDTILQGLQKHEFRLNNIVSGVSSVNGSTGAVTLTTANVAENTNLYFTNARGIAATLTGFIATSGTVAATDSVLTAIQKLAYSVNNAVTGVASVNGATGVVTLTTTNIAEGSNLYFTTGRAQAAITGTAPISVAAGVVSISQSSSTTNGYLSSTDWSTFNAKAPTASPTFTGTPVAPTAAVDTNTTQLATTAFVIGQGYLKSSVASTTYAPIASPVFTGTPAAPTPTAGDSSTKLATTAFVATSYAPLASPALTGNPTAPTPTAGDNDTSIATTAFVTGGIATAIAPLAPIASPALTGNPTAPTPAAGDNDTSIATTAFVTAAIAVNSKSIVTKSANYTVTATDYTILVDATAGAVTLTLPASPLVGQELNIKKVDSSANAVTITTTATIDGASSLIIPAQWQAYYMQWSGTAWYIM